MPTQNVAVPHREFLERCSRHDQVIGGLEQIDLRLQKLLAELVMLRLFDEFQEALAGVALRLACGTPYIDGTMPALLATPARTTSGARTLFETHGRRKPTSMKWSRVKFINETTKHVFRTSEPFVVACNANALAISEMQAIRNRIAHANTNSRGAFASVVGRYYGAPLNGVSPGTLLLSPRFTPTLLERYVAVCRLTTAACARA